VLTFVKERKAFHGKRQQLFAFYLLIELAHLSFDGAVDPRISDERFPRLQELVLFLQAAEVTSFQCVSLDIFHDRFDFSFVAWRIRTGGRMTTP
jgi:hypothetical protein